MTASRAERDARQFQIGGAAIGDKENGPVRGGPLFKGRAIGNESMRKESAGNRPAVGANNLLGRILQVRRINSRSVVRSGRDLLVDTASVEAAYERLLNSEQPPLMPSERRLGNNAPSV